MSSICLSVLPCLTLALAGLFAVGSVVKELSCASMAWTRGAVVCLGASFSKSATAVELMRPNPPNLAGRANNALSTSKHGGHPVKAESAGGWRLSRAERDWAHCGTVFEMYVHLVLVPCTKAVWAAWVWLVAMMANFSTSLVQLSTFPQTYSSANSLEPMAAPRGILPCVVMWMTVSAKTDLAVSSCFGCNGVVAKEGTESARL